MKQLAVAGNGIARQYLHHLIFLSFFVGAVSGTATGQGVYDAESAPCRFTPAASADGSSPGLILGAGGPVHGFTRESYDELTFMAHVAHVGEGRKASCAARLEVARYLRHVQRRDRRYALGLEDRLGVIKPGLRADLVLVEHGGGSPHDAVLMASHREVLGAWVDGRAILLSETLPESLGAGQCVALDGMAPRVCGALPAFGLSPATFAGYVEGSVPVNDVSRQASCEVTR